MVKEEGGLYVRPFNKSLRLKRIFYFSYYKKKIKHINIIKKTLYCILS